MKKNYLLLLFCLMFLNSFGLATPNLKTDLACPTATIIYSSPYCQSYTGAQSVYLTGTGAYTGGVYSSTPGLNINAVNGDIITSSSTAGMYTVTYTIATDGICPVFMATTTVTIIAAPIGTATPSTQTICSGETINIILSSDIPGTIYNWNLIQAGVTGGSAGSGNTISQTFTNLGNDYPGEAVYIVSYHADGCPGNYIEVRITVNPAPKPTLADGVITIEQSTGNVIQSYVLDSGLDDNIYDFAWSLNGVGIPGATGTTLNATVEGTYCVVATNTATGCISETVCSDVSQVLGTNGFNLIQLVYSPNPVTALLNIKSNEIIKKVTVFNTLGQTVYVNNFNDLNPQLELSSLVSGNYFIRVESDSKQKVFKIIKE